MVFLDGDPGPEIRRKLNEMVGTWEDAIINAKGWSPVFSVISDGQRRVLQIADWIDGIGNKPTTSGYIGATGIVTDIALAVDIRGPIGLTGPAGPSNTLAIGTVVTGISSSATITGTSPNQTLNLTLQKGDKGDKGDTGDTGPANTLAIGTVTSGASPSATITGTSPNQTLNLVLQKGDKGDTGWSPVFAIVNDGTRRVQQVIDWTGGQGTKPATGQYVGATGLVATVASAVDIRGPAGTGNVSSTGTITADSIALFADNTGSVIKSFTPAGDLVGTTGTQTLTNKTINLASNTVSGTVAQFNAALSDGDFATLAGSETLTNKTLTDPKLQLGGTNGTAGQVPVSQGAGLPPVWGTVSTPEIKTPINVSPANGATNIGNTPTITGSTYYSLYGVEMAAAQWQVSTVSNFSTTVVNTGDVAGTAVTYNVVSGALSTSTTYYWRVRYKGSSGVYSDWSAPTTFNTASSFNSFITTPTPTPANFGDPLEGGFYAGMIWNEVTTSATSLALATGSQTFTVAVNMDATPLFYSDQQIEVRSRANPNNRFIGTVTGATGTTLTVNVTSITGSGTFADWSIMSRYRVIVSPKASGENASIAWKNANTAGPVATQTLNEGWRATEAMRLAGDSTVYPSAHWCRSLNIGGRTDWYLPARDEHELCWRNLKPVTDNNYVTSNRPTASYLRDGAFNDTANTHGKNNNSAPTGAAYTTTVPGQVAATAFIEGGAEAFDFSSSYWSSTEYDASSAWCQYWFAAGPGCQVNSDKTNTYRVRAVRRSII